MLKKSKENIINSIEPTLKPNQLNSKKKATLKKFTKSQEVKKRIATMLRRSLKQKGK
ncbi:615_t:CDS:2 [Scutellospora calospora]|uniref:615_t:CDS:1 n=1 Tax=Scutellospora calospora TaxID=85575 RepID=A0ACA9K395_9GLOM|nr:615_t:CDS:2 [Scutellospora calospora]